MCGFPSFLKFLFIWGRETKGNRGRERDRRTLPSHWYTLPIPAVVRAGSVPTCAQEGTTPMASSESPSSPGSVWPDPTHAPSVSSHSWPQQDPTNRLITRVHVSLASEGSSAGSRGCNVPCRGHSMVWLRSREGCVENPARKSMLLTPVILTEWRPLL